MQSGYYWVKIKSRYSTEPRPWQIAEWNIEDNAWYVIGDDQGLPDSYIIEVSHQIERPEWMKD